MYGQCVAIEHLYCALCIVWLCYGYGMVRYGHRADGRARTAPTGFASPLLPPTKEFLLLQFPYLALVCIVQDPQVRRMAVDIISARILWCQEFAALNAVGAPPPPPPT